MTQAPIPERWQKQAREIVGSKFYHRQYIRQYVTGDDSIEMAFNWRPDDLVDETALRLQSEAKLALYEQALREITYFDGTSHQGSMAARALEEVEG